MSRSLRIAVADDEPDLLDYYQKALAYLGHQAVAVARSGRELIDQCRAVRPDVVITDIQMPDMDGIAAAAAIYRDAPVPIILASAHHTEGLIEQAEASHVFAYLVKPVRMADLATSIAIARQRFVQLRALESLSLTDELTGLYNRRGFLALAEQQVKLARRQQQRLSLLVIDVDGLKRINDTYGHPAGDQVLKATAEVLRKTFRGSDVLARLGGDEYCVLVVDDASGVGAAAIQRLLKSLEAYNASNDAPTGALSLSMGAIEVDLSSEFGFVVSLAQADERMYEQKQEKRPTEALGGKFESSPTVN